MRRESTAVTWRQRIHGAPVRMIVPDAVPDETMFFLLAVLAGGVCGYLVGIG
jgi:hypothetical protein